MSGLVWPWFSAPLWALCAAATVLLLRCRRLGVPAGDVAEDFGALLLICGGAGAALAAASGIAYGVLSGRDNLWPLTALLLPFPGAALGVLAGTGIWLAGERPSGAGPDKAPDG